MNDITCLMQKEENLRLLSLAVGQNPCMVIITDAKGGIEYVSQKFTLVTGYQYHEVAGKNVQVLNSDKTPPEIYKQMRKTISSGNEWRGEFCYTKKSGEDFRVFAAISPVRNQEGVVTHFVGILDDITERKQLEEKIHLLQNIIVDSIGARNLKDAFNMILSKVCNVTGWVFGEVWAPDSERIYMECSLPWYTRRNDLKKFRKMSRKFRFRMGEGLPGRAWKSKAPVWVRDVTQDDNFPRALLAEEHGLRTGMAIPILSVNGEVVAVLTFFAFESHKEDERMIRFVSSVAAQLGLVIQRKQLEDDLRKANAQNEQLISSISSILICIDKNDRVIEWNAVAERTFGIANDTVIGRPFSDCGIQWKETGIVKRILDCQRETYSVLIDDVGFKYPEGENGFLSINVNHIIGDHGRHIGLLLVGEDVTERKFLEIQLLQAQKLESIGQLAAGIAHEINTPAQYVGDNTRFLKDAFDGICKLMGKYAELLKAYKNGMVTGMMIQDIETAEKEADREYIIEEIPKAIHQSLEGIGRITKIVSAMKDFSHPGTVEKTPIDINRAIESTITVARNEWKYVANMVTDYYLTLPPVLCLPNEFNQAVLNVIINAAHAIADVVGDGHKGKGTITVSTKCYDNQAEIRIQDTGTGIPEEIRTKIFDPFFTTKQVGRGTGQGLSLVHSFVTRKHGGTINCETEEGKGTTFIIRIPVK